MKPLIEVERNREEISGQRYYSMYLRYSNGDPMPPTKMLDPAGSVNVDFDAKGDIVGIELVHVNDSTVAIATRFANEQGLGLAGVFERDTHAA
jgi:uncharacterized protein YuzE